MLKKMVSIVLTTSMFLFCSNIAFADEVIEIKQPVRKIGKITISNLELDGYEKAYDKESGIYIFTQKNEENIKIIENIIDSPKIQILHSEFIPEFIQEVKSIDDIENEAQYIIKGKVLENNKNVLTPEGGGYTETNLEITDVYKGNLNIGDIITLVELYYTSKDGVEIRRDGYSASVPGEEYLFYIGPQYEDGTYGIVCTVFGRYSLDDTQSIETNIAEEYAPLYNQLKKEVRNRYQ